VTVSTLSGAVSIRATCIFLEIHKRRRLKDICCNAAAESVDAIKTEDKVLCTDATWGTGDRTPPRDASQIWTELSIQWCQEPFRKELARFAHHRVAVDNPSTLES
jgi:hypothetical protein